MPPWPGLVRWIGRHLRQARRRRPRRGALVAGWRDDVAGLDEGGRSRRRRSAISSSAHSHELVDVELVVGEQHEVLEMLRRWSPCSAAAGAANSRCAGAVNGASGSGSPAPGSNGAVGDVVVGAVEVRHVEDVAQRPVDACRRPRPRHGCPRGRRNAAGSACRRFRRRTGTPWLRMISPSCSIR